MADLTYIQQTQEVKIAGQDSSGNNVNYVGADANGNLQVKDYADGTAGSAVPAVVTQVGGSDGTNLRAVSTDATGKINVAQEISSNARAGKVFLCSTDVVTISSTSETPLFYLNNPNASGKSARFKGLSFIPSGGSNSTVEYRAYLNPTVTANGTALTINGARQTSQATTALSAFKQPSVSANGTLLFISRVSNSSASDIDLDLGLWLEANNKLLITVILSNTNLPTCVNMTWIEE